MHDCRIRKNGGIGFSIKNERNFIKAKISREVIVTPADSALSIRKLKYIEDRLHTVKEELSLKYGVEIDLSNINDFHIGLGTGTSVTLACIESLLLLNGVEYTKDLLVKFSGRGGTSGVGVNTYFGGGVSLDIGVKADGKKHQPSSSQQSEVVVPTLVYSGSMPEWEFCVVHPRNGIKIEGENENKFFDRVCPIDDDEAYKACYYSLFGVLGSIIDSNYDAFTHSINSIQRTKWKASEIDAHYGAREKMDYLLSLGADCVGLSSIGPSMYFFGKDLEFIKEKFTKLYDWESFISRPDNAGRVICWS
ncbi:hypothetical protein AR688_01220 [Rheinheimera sp. EpRS3]|nr:hypothetical protein AR688_01220 [Rheinheimera sp. EpRS3]